MCGVYHNKTECKTGDCIRCHVSVIQYFLLLLLQPGRRVLPRRCCATARRPYPVAAVNTKSVKSSSSSSSSSSVDLLLLLLHNCVIHLGPRSLARRPERRRRRRGKLIAGNPYPGGGSFWVVWSSERDSYSCSESFLKYRYQDLTEL
jgi:hypothetical protein